MLSTRLLVVLAAAGVGVVAVGFAAAATMSARNDSARATNDVTRTKTTSSPSSVVVSPNSTSDSKDVAEFWTPERMRNAQPMDKTVPGGSPSSSAPTGKGTAVPAGTARTSAPATKPAKKATKSQAPAPVASGPNTSGSAAEYWTPEKMQDAQPQEMTAPGGGGSGGSSSPPGSGVTIP